MCQIKLYTSYFGNYRNIPPEYQCVSIANSKPKIGVPTWMDVVPDWSDVEAFKKQKMTALEFTMRYIHKLDSKPAIQYLNYLKSFSSDTIVLLCWEKHYFDCHRLLLADWLHYNLKLDIDEYPSEYYVLKEQRQFELALEWTNELRKRMENRKLDRYNIKA